LKKSLADGFEDGLVAVVERQFDLDGTIVLQFGRAIGMTNLVQFAVLNQTRAAAASPRGFLLGT
jgi:hypothetical protein